MWRAIERQHDLTHESTFILFLSKSTMDLYRVERNMLVHWLGATLAVIKQVKVMLLGKSLDRKKKSFTRKHDKTVTIGDSPWEIDQECRKLRTTLPTNKSYSQQGHYITFRLCWFKGWPWQPRQTTTVRSQRLRSTLKQSMACLGNKDIKQRLAVGLHSAREPTKRTHTWKPSA